MLLSHGWATRLIRERVKNAEILESFSIRFLEFQPRTPQKTAKLSDDLMASLTVGISTHSTRATTQKMFSTTTLRMHLLKARTTPSSKMVTLRSLLKKTDFLGINYYSRAVIASDKLEDRAHRIPDVGPEMRTDMGWEVYPTGLYDLMKRIHDDYKVNALIITENGAAYDDGPDPQEEYRTIDVPLTFTDI